MVSIHNNFAFGISCCIDSIVDDLSFRANVETDEEEVLAMLKIIQEFDPAITSMISFPITA